MRKLIKISAPDYYNGSDELDIEEKSHALLEEVLTRTYDCSETINQLKWKKFRVLLAGNKVTGYNRYASQAIKLAKRNSLFQRDGLLRLFQYLEEELDFKLDAYSCYHDLDKHPILKCKKTGDFYAFDDNTSGIICIDKNAHVIKSAFIVETAPPVPWSMKRIWFFDNIKECVAKEIDLKQQQDKREGKQRAPLFGNRN